MNECACNSMSQHNGKDSLLSVLRSDFLSGGREGRSMVLVIQGVDLSWMAGESRLRVTIFSLCCAVDDNSGQIYLSWR